MLLRREPFKRASQIVLLITNYMPNNCADRGYIVLLNGAKVVGTVTYSFLSGCGEMRNPPDEFQDYIGENPAT